MFGPLKNFFSLDTVKLRFNVLDVYPKDVNSINGEIILYSNSLQCIQALNIRFMEVYTKGTGNDKRITEYELGIWKSDTPIYIKPGETKSILFKVPFEFLKSNVDRFGDKNFLFKGISNLAKTLKGVQSEFYLHATADIEKNKLSPFVKTSIKFQ